MASLFDTLWASTNATPPDTEAFRLGAQRIRETRDAVQAFLTKIFNDDSTFKTNVVPGTVLTNASVSAGQMAANAITAGNGALADGAVATTAKVADNILTAVKLVEAARGDVHQFAAGSLAAGVYTVTLTPAPTAYTAGMVVRFTASGANTGAVSVNVNALGNKSIVRGTATALAANDILSGQLVTLVYDGTNFQFQGALPSSFASGNQGLNGITFPNTLVNLAHGLSATPSFVRWVMVCVGSDATYITGDEVDIDCFWDAVNSRPNFAGGANATNVFLSGFTATPRVLGKDGTVQIPAITTNTKWAAKCYARL